MMPFVRREPFPSPLGRKQRGGDGIERSCIPDTERGPEALYDYYRNPLSLSRSSARARTEQRKSSRACWGSAASFQVLDTLTETSGV